MNSTFPIVLPIYLSGNTTDGWVVVDWNFEFLWKIPTHIDKWGNWFEILEGNEIIWARNATEKENQVEYYKK